MKKKIYYILFAIFTVGIGLSSAQPTVYPAKAQQESIAIVGGTIHVGNGQVIENGTVVFDGGKISFVGTSGAPTASTTVDAKGKHVYPGLIAPVTNLGLIEVSSVRATLDNAEIGENNAHVRSLIAYNTDSKVINTLRSNGILLAQITPESGLVSGQSSVVQLDAWNWEDAAYKTDDALHINWPAVVSSRRSGGGGSTEQQEQRIQKDIATLESLLADAKAYAANDKPEVFNARLEAFRGAFSGSKKVMVHVNHAKDIIAAIYTMKKYALQPVIVGGTDAHLVADVLKENDVPVIIHQSHSLPSREDDDVYVVYKQAKTLTDAGILVAYGMNGFWQQRNLPFMAGTAAAYGLDKEQALATVTLNTAKILGIDDIAGSIEVGKDANLFVSEGDALDMKGNQLEKAFILGKDISLDNLHKQLFERYEHKYTEQ